MTIIRRGVATARPHVGLSRQRYDVCRPVYRRYAGHGYVDKSRIDAVRYRMYGAIIICVAAPQLTQNARLTPGSLQSPGARTCFARFTGATARHGAMHYHPSSTNVGVLAQRPYSLLLWNLLSLYGFYRNIFGVAAPFLLICVNRLFGYI